MTDSIELTRRNLREVFGQRDRDARLAVMRALYTDESTFADHDGVVNGIDAITEKITALHERTPGFVFTEDGQAHAVADLVSLSWTYGPAGGPPVVHGTDVVLVDGDRIRALYTYLT